MKMKIHKEGIRILLTVLLLLTVINLIIIRQYTPSNLLYVFLATISSTFYCWLLYFFRDPLRSIIANKKHVLAPADGKVVAIKEIYEDEYFKDKRLQVSIFMSPFNVHVNRSPIEGVVKFFRYHAGRYLVAFNPKSSKKNERTTVVVENEDGVELMFRQIAGFVARRIKFYQFLVMLSNREKNVASSSLVHAQM